MKIAIDKGHGSGDPGAIGNGLEEHILTDKIGNGIIKRLQIFDVEVLEVPRYKNLADRTIYANKNGANFYLSVHTNAGGGTGFESFVYTNASIATANIQEVLHNQVMKLLSQYGIKDRGKKKANFAVLRETRCPAVLLENLFIDNANDAKFLRDDTFLDKLANEITYGLVVALGLEKCKPTEAERIERLEIEVAEIKKQLKELAN